MILPSIFKFASLLALVTTSVARQTSTRSNSLPMATSTVPLNVAAKAAGKLYFGSATDNRKLSDPAYLAVLKDTDTFGQLTPENSMKWDAIEPEQNVFDFTGGDQIVALAEETGKIMRGHALVWFQQLPDWVVYGTWTQETLASVLENHVRTQVSHYRGKIYAWDVVNEPLSDNGTMRANIFYDTLGKSYISTALQAARAADPSAKLYLNDYDLEYPGPKVDAMVQLVEDLLAAGVPIDGIGFQCHYILGQVDPYQLRTNMERFTVLGLEVAVTELDDRIPLPVTDADLYQQKADYMAIVRTCMVVPECVGVTVWDFPDKYSWVPSFYPGYGDPCPWYSNLAHKPAYDGIAIGFTNSNNTVQ